MLQDLPTPFTATRYHSLAVEEPTVPAELEVTGRTPGGVVMALRHRDAPVEGVQFHPESVLTQGGHLLLAAWLRSCGDTGATGLAPALGAAGRGQAAGRLRLSRAISRPGWRSAVALGVGVAGGVGGRASRSASASARVRRSAAGWWARASAPAAPPTR